MRRIPNLIPFTGMLAPLLLSSSSAFAISPKWYARYAPIDPTQECYSINGAKARTIPNVFDSTLAQEFDPNSSAAVQNLATFRSRNLNLFTEQGADGEGRKSLHILLPIPALNFDEPALTATAESDLLQKAEFPTLRIPEDPLIGSDEGAIRWLPNSRLLSSRHQGTVSESADHKSLTIRLHRELMKLPDQLPSEFDARIGLVEEAGDKIHVVTKFNGKNVNGKSEVTMDCDFQRIRAFEK